MTIATTREQRAEAFIIYVGVSIDEGASSYDKKWIEHGDSEYVLDADRLNRLASTLARRDVELERLRRIEKAAGPALKELQKITGYSGSAGNWPLQEAEANLRIALAASHTEKQ